MLAAGPEMDREIARKLNGDAKPRPAAYSTSETAAERVLRRLRRDGLASTVEFKRGAWHCTIWRGPSASGEPIAVGIGETRPLAVGRAVLNATFETGAPVRANNAHPLFAKGIARPPQGGLPRCRTCGVDLPIRARTRLRRYCGVCSWNRIKERFASAPLKADS